MQRQRVRRPTFSAAMDGRRVITIPGYRNERVGGDVALPDAWRVNLDDALLMRLREWLQPENVQVVY